MTEFWWDQVLFALLSLSFSMEYARLFTFSSSQSLVEAYSFIIVLGFKRCVALPEHKIYRPNDVAGSGNPKV